MNKFLKVKVDWNLPAEVRMAVDVKEHATEVYVRARLNELFGRDDVKFTYETTELTDDDVNALKSVADKYDYFDVTDKIEEIFGMVKGYGTWQEVVTILPNFKEVAAIMEGVKPICVGKFWVAYYTEDMSSELADRLEREDFWLIDYITRSDFERNGITE